MRLFQNSGLMPAYVRRLRKLARPALSFADQRRIVLADRYGASHLLKPVLDEDSQSFFTNGDDQNLQRAWAREQGMRSDASIEEVLLSQIEAHRTEVFYNLDPVRYPSSFIQKLPGCVKHAIAWRAAPSGSADFSAYDLIVSNFPSINESYRKIGWRTAYFAPAHDPEMDAYARSIERPVDVVFIGSYSRNHRQRAGVLEAVAKLRDRYDIVYHIDSSSKFLRLAESPMGAIGPLRKYRRPSDIRAVEAPPVFGRDLYACLSRAKIVINGAIDMAGADRGNMRCWEAMGCGVLLLSDAGNYPEGMSQGKTMATYSSIDEAVAAVKKFLAVPSAAADLAAAGYAMIREHYSKERQWQAFQALI
ncbi:glycosyltransferase [Methylocystis sp. H4A]|uniref:glycosyltransferase family protein n=1 Tax=Methylocystis sp. H4A TaxID=2785788 RepID=UPI0018C23EE6|nr:glycosyltransferase [Methylocystis sp. H4A]MBG0799954.1 glycosyltransferase [Methylocystis sp. H4A]